MASIVERIGRRGIFRSESISVKMVNGFDILLFLFELPKIKSILIWFIVVLRRAIGCGIGWGIYQRCLEDFTEKVFLDNKLTNNNCINCHSFLYAKSGQDAFFTNVHYMLGLIY